MAHTCTRIVVHCVFSTLGRTSMIDADLRNRLWPYMGGIARDKRIKPIAIGGTDNHTHLLLEIPPTVALSDAMRVIKAVSSKWINETDERGNRFSWQEGYGAFSVDSRRMDRLVEYIHNQEEHHRNRTFEEEYRALLKEFGLEYDERYLWG